MGEERDYLVTVCSACRRASCWHDSFPCANATTASTVDVLASKLREEDREHPSHFSRERLIAVCGQVKDR